MDQEANHTGRSVDIEESRKNFDEASLTWDDSPGRMETADRVAGAIERKVTIPQGGRMLDYGCATGLVSSRYAGTVEKLIVMDTSPGMLEKFARRSRSLEIPPERILFQILEPDRDILPGISEESMDLIISSMTFHHIPEIVPVLKRFREALLPGGSVVIVDLDREDGSFHVKGNDGVAHFGFDRSVIQDGFQRAGFDSIEIDTAFEHHRGETGRTYPFFIAIGKK